MLGGQNDIVITLQQRDTDREGWLRAPVRAGPDIILWSLLNPGVPQSSISPKAQRDLARWAPDHIAEAPGGYHVLHGPTVQGQRLPDITVRVSRLAALLDIDCFIGYDFLTLFKEIRFATRTLQVTLMP